MITQAGGTSGALLSKVGLSRSPCRGIQPAWQELFGRDTRAAVPSLGAGQEAAGKGTLLPGTQPYLDMCSRWGLCAFSSPSLVKIPTSTMTATTPQMM